MTDFPDRECVEHLAAAAASLIERLTAENAALREKQRWIPVTERLEKEKAALLEYVKKSARCEQCASYRPQCDAVLCVFCAEDCPCQKCKRGSEWEWKGLEDAL